MVFKIMTVYDVEQRGYNADYGKRMNIESDTAQLAPAFSFQL